MGCTTYHVRHPATLSQQTLLVNRPHGKFIEMCMAGTHKSELESLCYAQAVHLRVISAVRTVLLTGMIYAHASHHFKRVTGMHVCCTCKQKNILCKHGRCVAGAWEENGAGCCIPVHGAPNRHISTHFRNMRIALQVLLILLSDCLANSNIVNFSSCTPKMF